MPAKPKVPPYVDDRQQATSDRLNNKRFYKRLQRQYRKMQKEKAAHRHSHPLLVALRGDITEARRARDKRKGKPSGPSHIRLRNFSIVDDPAETLLNLSSIARADAIGDPYYVDFMDQVCLDIAPYLIFGQMRRQMQKNICRGGKIADELCHLITSLRMQRFLNMRYPIKTISTRIRPFPIVEQSERINSNTQRHLDESKKENAAKSFARSLNSWLDDANYELSAEGAENVRALLGEILDNTRHAMPPNPNGGSDSDWCVAGFMAARARADGSDQLACSVAIISLGRDISETLEVAAQTDSDLKTKIEAYCDLHAHGNKPFDRAALITAMALTDGISCQPPAAGKRAGCGMSTFIDLINAVGVTNREDEQPQLTVISGTSCVQMKKPFNRMEKKHHEGGTTSYQCFNADQTGELPPSHDHVYKLPIKFPGTVISARFFLDKGALDSLHKPGTEESEPEYKGSHHAA